jgi:mannose-6-phosphate isomerase-like protein (cupin superfamily)
MIRITGELAHYLGRDITNAILWVLGWYFAVLPLLKLVSFGVCALLAWGIFYSITKGGYNHFYSDQWADRRWAKDMVARKMRRKWKSALANIQDSRNRTAWILALKDAETVVQEAFRIRGYSALNNSDRSRLAYEAGEYKALPDLKVAQAAYAKAQNEGMPFTHEEAIAGLRAYKKIIRETGILGVGFL